MHKVPSHLRGMPNHTHATAPWIVRLLFILMLIITTVASFAIPDIVYAQNYQVRRERRITRESLPAYQPQLALSGHGALANRPQAVATSSAFRSPRAHTTTTNVTNSSPTRPSIVAFRAR